MHLCTHCANIPRHAIITARVVVDSVSCSRQPSRLTRCKKNIYIYILRSSPVSNDQSSSCNWSLCCCSSARWSCACSPPPLSARTRIYVSRCRPSRHAQLARPWSTASAARFSKSSMVRWTFHWFYCVGMRGVDKNGLRDFDVRIWAKILNSLLFF